MVLVWWVKKKGGGGLKGKNIRSNYDAMFTHCCIMAK